MVVTLVPKGPKLTGVLTLLLEELLAVVVTIGVKDSAVLRTPPRYTLK